MPRRDQTSEEPTYTYELPESDPQLAVRGEHVRQVDPEIAHVVVDLAARAATKEEVVEQLRERTQWMRSVIDGFAQDIERVDTAVFRVYPIFDPHVADTPAGYAGTIRTKLTIGDPGHVGEIVSQLSLGHMSQVVALEWALRETSQVHREIRMAAVREALRRARDYAAALGSELTGVIELRDVGLRAYDPSGARRQGYQQATEERPGHQFDFDPAVQTVSVQVEARFTMTQPNLG
jgi:uncharacterized protein